jgi:hypothetical protein
MIVNHETKVIEGSNPSDSTRVKYSRVEWHSRDTEYLRVIPLHFFFCPKYQFSRFLPCEKISCHTAHTVLKNRFDNFS